MLLLLLTFYNVLATIQFGICSSSFEECSWIFDFETKHLTCRGIGSMLNFTSDEPSPWTSLCEKIETVTIEGLNSIGDNAFSGCTILKDVSIPTSVTFIGEGAFNLCLSLRRINIPNSVTSIGNFAFYSCESLKHITIPNSVTFIGYSAFSSCSSLQSVTIPNSVTSIKQRTFYSCYALKLVVIPNSVTSIANNAFSYCLLLTSITLPESLTSIEDSSFSFCALLRSIKIQLTNSLSEVNPNAFSGCNSLTTLVITGNGPMSCYTELDYQNSLWGKFNFFTKKLVIENGITSIGNYSFYQMSNLETILIPETVTSIGFNSIPDTTKIKTVYYEGLTGPLCENDYSTSQFNVIVPSSFNSESNFCLKNVENNGFEGKCGDNCEWKINSTLSLLTIDGSGVMNGFESDAQPWYILSEMFKKVEIKGVVSIGDYAFHNNILLETVIISDSVNKIGDYSFYGTLLLKTFTSKVQYFGSHSFDNSGIETIEIGNGIDSNNEIYICEYAFNNCFYLKSVQLKPIYPNDANDKTKKSCSIQKYAFTNCLNIESFIIDGYVDEVREYAFSFNGLNSVNFEYNSSSPPLSCSNFDTNFVVDSIIQPIFSENVKCVNVPIKYKSMVFCKCDKFGCPIEYVDTDMFLKLEDVSVPILKPFVPESNSSSNQNGSSSESSSSDNNNDSSSNQSNNSDESNSSDRAILNLLLITIFLILMIN